MQTASTPLRTSVRAGAAMVLACLLTACAGAPPPQAGAPGTRAAAQTPEAEKLHCTREIPVGSQMPVTRCRTLAQIDAERAEATNQLNVPRQAGTPGVNDRSGR